jgi:hypothetical protein
MPRSSLREKGIKAEKSRTKVDHVCTRDSQPWMPPECSHCGHRFVEGIYIRDHRTISIMSTENPFVGVMDATVQNIDSPRYGDVE